MEKTILFKRTTLLIAYLFLFRIVCDGMDIFSTSSSNIIETKTEDDGSIIIKLLIRDIDTSSIIIDEQKYYKITIPEGHSPLHKGLPDLPVITRNFIIPDDELFYVDIVEESFYDYDLRIAPSKGSIYRNLSWDSIPYVFSDVYSSDEYYPSVTTITSEPFLIRNIQGGSIEICPFRYNPISEKLRVYYDLKVRVSFSGNAESNKERFDNKTVNSHFKTILHRQFVNYDYYIGNKDDASQYDEGNRSLNEQSANMLVICCDSFVTEMRDFIIHKNNLGLPSTLVKMSDVGTTPYQVQSFIQNAYNNDNNLTYVLLVGDAPQIPPRTIVYWDYEENEYVYAAADPLLSLVSGYDNIPDIVIGRFSAETKQDVKTMVDRVIRYENEIESNWFHKGIGIASNIYSNNEYDWEHMRDIRSTLLSGHFYDVDEFYEGTHGLMDSPGNPYAATIVDSINAGVSLINYAGHGEVDRWLTSNFTNNNVDLLNNEYNHPFIYSVACYVGEFNNTNSLCFAEKWQRARLNNTNIPTGCIGFYGSSMPQTLNEPNFAQDSFNEQLINEDYLSIGLLCYSSACEMMSHFITGQAHVNATERFQTWILFGDPSLRIIPNNNIGKTIFIKGNINSDSTYTKKYVDVHDAVIKNGTDVIIDHIESSTFTGPFKVELGATLLVK